MHRAYVQRSVWGAATRWQQRQSGSVNTPTPHSYEIIALEQATLCCDCTMACSVWHSGSQKAAWAKQDKQWAIVGWLLDESCCFCLRKNKNFLWFLQGGTVWAPCYQSGDICLLIKHKTKMPWRHLVAQCLFTPFALHETQPGCILHLQRHGDL